MAVFINAEAVMGEPGGNAITERSRKSAIGFVRNRVMAESKSDIAQLEMAFAKEPTLEACLSLAQAYLESSRFMEAMVVCKKGIRNHADSVDARMLLARIYAEQGKVPKAIQEIEGLFQIDANVADAHCLLGQLHERAGRHEEAIESFKQAIILDRGQTYAVEALERQGVDFDPGPTPEEIEAQKAAEEEARRQAEEEAKRRAEEEARRKAEEKAIALAEHNRKLAEAALGQEAVANAPAQAIASFSPSFLGTYDPHAQNPKKRQQNLKFTIAMGAVGSLAVLFAIYLLWSWNQQVAKIGSILTSAKELVDSDTTDDLRQAAEKYEEVQQIDDDEPVSAGRLAWIYQTLVMDRGTTDLDSKAESAVAHAEKVASDQWYTAAASAKRLIWLGKMQEAQSRLDALRDLIPDGKPLPPRFRMVEGEILLRQGKHSQLTPIFTELKEKNDPAVLAWLGRTWRYLGDPLRAQAALSGALRFSPNHDAARAQRGLLGLDISHHSMSESDKTHLFDLGLKDLGQRQASYARLIRSELLRQNGETEKANSDFEKVSASAKRDPDYLLIDGRRLLEQKQFKAATEQLTAGIKKRPYQLELHRLLIEAAAAAKDSALAEESFNKANQLFPNAVSLQVARIRALVKARKVDVALSFAQESLKTKEKAELHREIGRISLMRIPTGQPPKRFQKPSNYPAQRHSVPEPRFMS